MRAYRSAVYMVAVWMAGALAFGDGTLDAAQKTYEESDAKIAADLASGREVLLKAYEKGLAKIVADFKAEGSLDKYLAAKQEVTRFEFDRSVPDTNPPGLVAPLASLRSRYHKAEREDELEGLDRRLKLAEQYEAYLRKVIKGFVTSDKIEEAKLVDAELKRFTPVREALASRQQVLAASRPASVPETRPAVAPPAPAAGPAGVMKSLVQGYKGDVIEVDFDKGVKHNVKLDPKSGGYLFDGEGSYYRLDRDLPQKLGRQDFSLVFDIRPERRQNAEAYLVEHHRGPPWTGLMVAIEGNSTLRFRLKDSPHCQVIGDIGDILGDGKFHHVALSRQGRSLHMYVDGKTIASGEQPEAVDLDIDYAGNFPVVGAHCENAPGASYAGGLRNMVFFIGRCLTAQDIQRLAN